MKFGKAVVKCRVPILIVALALLIPAVFGMVNTRINYDMLNYLPEDMDTVIGQDELMEDFGKGAFSFIIVEDMPAKDVSALKTKIEAVNHVETVLWYDSIADISIPMEILPDSLYEVFNAGNATMMAVFFDTSTSSDDTMDAIREIRSIAGKQCFVSGMSALVTDLKDLCEQEEPIYVAIAVVLATVAMMLFMDNWLIPFVFLASIGIAIVINLGTNYFMGEISYITKALSAVLQLAVTMDYSIFLWHSYNEQRTSYPDRLEAMGRAIHETLTSVVGSSITTIAGFIALCFMSFTLGRDLGIVKIFPVFLVLFVALVIPFYYGYDKTNDEVYYDMGECLPENIDYVTANRKLQDEFNVASTHMILVDANLPSKDVKAMSKEMEAVDGVKYVVGLDTLLGSRLPEAFLPDAVTSTLKSDRWQLLLINSEYRVASAAVNTQIDALNTILKRYDEGAMLIGEGPCMKDMIETTDTDFKVVNTISIVAIFVIILLVEKSISLPFILVAVIELAIFINLGLPHFLGQSLPFIAPICISTIQLGATVDYAILMTTRYKSERAAGQDKRTAVTTALSTSIPSILVSALGLFAATFGVAVYSDIDIISSMCSLMARGAIISMFCVVLILPAMLMLFDKIIRATTLGFKAKKQEK